VIAGMVVLVLLIGVMAYKILNTKPPTVVAEPTAAPAAAPAAPSAPLAAATPPAAPRPTGIPDENLPPREAAAKPAGEVKADGKSEKSDRHHGGRSRDKGEKKGAAPDDKKGGNVVAAAAAAPEPAEKKPAKGSLDELLESATRSRGASARRDDDAPAKKVEAAPSGPLSKGAVVSGMNSVKGKISECYNQYKVPGTAMVNVVIGKNGKVSSATVTGKFAGTPTGACVEKAVKTASFPPSDGLTTPYPFQLK
jgi:hypothetical protein